MEEVRSGHIIVVRKSERKKTLLYLSINEKIILIDRNKFMRADT
jgi:hypothetical protein